ncbi:MAG: hypothetical protein AAFV80_16465 [Bacteroidota bacterium]
MKNLFLVGCSLLFCFSCAFSDKDKIMSNKSNDFNSKIDDVYVMILAAEQTAKFGLEVDGHLRKEFQKRNLNSKVRVQNPMGVESDMDAIRMVQGDGFKYLLLIDQTQEVVRKYRDNTGDPQNPGTGFIYTEKKGTFDVKLFQLGQDSPVWRGNLSGKTKGSLSSAKGNAKGFVKALIAELENDRLL